MTSHESWADPPVKQAGQGDRVHDMRKMSIHRASSAVVGKDRCARINILGSIKNTMGTCLDAEKLLIRNFS